MTNNEAIGILAIVVETAKGRCFVTDEAISDAYDMAISALQAQDSPKPTAESVQNVQNEDLILRNAAIDAILGITAMRNTIPLDSAIFNIKKLPSAQPERCEDCENFSKTRLLIPQPERKKGKWIVVDADIAENSDICECDKCRGRIWKYKNVEDMWNYCPRCGADMREEQDG